MCIGSLYGESKIINYNYIEKNNHNNKNNLPRGVGDFILYSSSIMGSEENTYYYYFVLFLS